MSYSKAIINSKQILSNLARIHANGVCAMVKANAYGLGLERICKILAGRVKFFGVATLEEALAIRAFDTTTSVLIAGFCSNFAIAAQNNVSVTIENPKQILDIINAGIDKIKIHLKINTGMNRYGIKNKKILKKIKNILKNNKKIILEGVFTHFYNPEDINITYLQFNKFKNLLKIFEKDFSFIPHIGGGAVQKTLGGEVCSLFMQRVGLNLYQNALKITSTVLKVFTLKPTESLGYAPSFSPNKKMQIALVPLGYADGINRRLSGQGYVEICGTPCRIVGAVCMDVFFVDVTGLAVKAGTPVTVLTNLQIWAKLCGTIPYEIQTNLNFSRMQIEMI